MKMKTLALLSLSLAVGLALPALPPGEEQSPVLTKENQRPLLGDLVPVQGHVEVENPAPQVIPPHNEEQEKVSEADMKQNMVELEVKVKPDGEQEVKAEPEAEVEKAGVMELEVKVKPEGKVEEKFEAQQEVKAEPEVPVEVEAKMVNAKAGMNPEGEGDQELKGDPEFQVESEVKVEPDQLKMEPEPEEKHMLDEENFQEHMLLVADPGLDEEEEKHNDIEENNKMVDEPIMELEPLDDDSLFGDEVSKSELTEEEKAMNTEFQSQDPVIEPEPEEEEMKNKMVDEPIMELEPLDDNNPPEPLLEEEEGFMRKRGYVLDEEPVMELEPEMREEPFRNAGILEEGPALDIMEQPVSLSENYFPNEEAKMAVRPEKQVAGDEKSLVQLYEEPDTEDQVVLDEGDLTGLVSEGENQVLMEDVATRNQRGSFKLCLKLCLSKRAMQEQHSCPGVVLEGKCYEFFKEPKRAADAELFCQEKFSGGHLASITSQYIHSELMKMILKKNGKYTRTWIGGLRFLETGRFIWLDGSRWEYADWLSGEPNTTANKQQCLEILAYENGKFNDFTCWEPQAFICSYYY